MYTDPWDLKHSIQQLQESQKQQNRLISNNRYSSSTYKQQLNEDTDYKMELSQDHTEEQNNSDENTHGQKSTNHQSYTKPLGDSFQSGNDVEFVQQPRNTKPHKKYGNLIVFFEINSTFLSIGPNCNQFILCNLDIFFFIAYTCFTISAIYLIYLVNSSVQNVKFKIFNFAFCALQNLSYLLVAFSNPGVKLPEQSGNLRPIESPQKRLCRSCDVIQQRKTYHCRVCDICVLDYDHHCPWTSKCIGGGNIKRFYFFVCMTPFYIFYYVVAFMICMASLTLPHAKEMKPVVPPTVL